MLQCSTLEEAEDALRKEPNPWSSPKPDDTIPTTDKERADWALRLVTAFKNTEGVIARDSDIDACDNLDGALIIESICFKLVVCIVVSRPSVHD